MKLEAAAGAAVSLLLLGSLVSVGWPIDPERAASPLHPHGALPTSRAALLATGSNGSALGNFSQALNRIVALLGAAGGAILAIAWARVALSWFSNDVTKKIQAKDRARDALIGTVIFAAALSGIVWGLAQWVLTGA